jgi:hypothetical protein
MHGPTVVIRQQEGEPKQSWANSRDPSAEKLAEAILLREALVGQRVIHHWTEIATPEGKEHVFQLGGNPEYYHFQICNFSAWGATVVIRREEDEPKQSWANSRDPSAQKLPEAILDRMLAFHEAGDPDVNPEYYHIQLCN